MIYTKDFWVQATERAIKTFAQFIVVLFTAEAFDMLTLDWQQTGLAALAGVVVSYATSIVSANIGEKGSPSLVSDKE
jgi:Putative lactococcus lactis phage r1t holin